jgi:hypothetical protein
MYIYQGGCGDTLCLEQNITLLYCCYYYYLQIVKGRALASGKAESAFWNF